MRLVLFAIGGALLAAALLPFWIVLAAVLLLVVVGFFVGDGVPGRKDATWRSPSR